MSRDLSNGSLKTGRQRAENLLRDLLKEREERKEKSTSRDLINGSLKTDREAREWRTYIGISSK